MAWTIEEALEWVINIAKEISTEDTEDDIEETRANLLEELKNQRERLMDMAKTEIMGKAVGQTIPLHKIAAVAAKNTYDALVAEGFTPQQATEIVAHQDLKELM